MKSFKKDYNNYKLQAIHASIHPDESESNSTYYPDSMEESIGDSNKEAIKKNFELSNELTNHYGSLLKNSNHFNIIKSYTSNSFPVNGDLWDKHHKTNVYSPSYLLKDVRKAHEIELSKKTSSMDKVLSRHKTPHDLTLWSSTVHDPRVKKNSEGVMHHPAYISTSIYKPVAINRDINSKEDAEGNFHHHILKIHVPEGHKGVYVDHASNYRGEFEFILPRGLNLKHTKTETSFEKMYNYQKEKYTKKHIHIHHMEIT